MLPCAIHTAPSCCSCGSAYHIHAESGTRASRKAVNELATIAAVTSPPDSAAQATIAAAGGASMLAWPRRCSRAASSPRRRWLSRSRPPCAHHRLSRGRALRVCRRLGRGRARRARRRLSRSRSRCARCRLSRRGQPRAEALSRRTAVAPRPASRAAAVPALLPTRAPHSRRAAAALSRRRRSCPLTSRPPSHAAAALSRRG